MSTTRFNPYLSEEKQTELRRTANAIVAAGKGILAADESTGFTSRIGNVDVYALLSVDLSTGAPALSLMYCALNIDIGTYNSSV